MSHDINLLLNNIRNLERKFITDNFASKVKEVVRNFFPKLNYQDSEIIQDLSVFIIDLISKKLSFDKNNKDYYDQWTQNNNRDIKGVILLLLPFIDDKDNSYLLKKISDLNQLLYSPSGKKYIPNSLKNEERNNTFLSTYFEFGNMGIGLLKSDSVDLLDLYPNNNKLIYDLICHNFFGLLKTLEIMNGKYYVNWINYSPLNLENYYDSNIFKATNEKINEIETNLQNINNFNEFEKNMMIDYSGIWFGNFYNIIRINYFENAKKIKWLFFPYEINQSKHFYLIQVLNTILDLDKIIESDNVNYEDMTDDDKKYFNDKFKNMVTNISLNNAQMTNIISLDFDILKYLLVFMTNNYSGKGNLPCYKSRFELSNNDSEFNNDDFSQRDLLTIDRITNREIINYLIILEENSIGHVWNFLKESMKSLINSSYGKFLIKKNKIVNTFYYEPFNSKFKNEDKYKNNVRGKLNLKNIYNIAKSLSHLNLSSWQILNKNYVSLDLITRFEYFLKILNIFNVREWINLNSNLNKQIQYPFDYNQKMNEIITAFKNTILILVFEELVSTGLINEFKPNLTITNKQLLPKDTNSKKKKIKDLIKKLFNDNKEAWLDSYYYLTNDRFRNLGKIRVEKKKNTDPNNKYKEVEYLEYLEDQEWPIFYAMDWICQISFFQHYIYHQVLYVTGATGQGKSTQVPKLLLYALKAIDNISNGKVACTQPRIPPTVGNATRIAEELGLPIEQTSNNSTIKNKTNNYWVQYKHQYDYHTNDKVLHGSLRIMTDGTLLEQLKSNPTMLKKISNGSNEIFINDNIYDILIVDESHEHGTNMDLIITLGKQACYLNNRVRLIIVSATMDDDEYIYRRYFSEINDYLLFPLKSTIEYPLVNKNMLLNPHYMDRRYHISPPGETTQYRVDEFYLDFDIIDKNEKAIANKAQELAYQKILEICNKSVIGEILFFANGENEILKATEYLNKILPQGNIALPYFANLNQNYKEIISKIDIKISQIKNKRENIHIEWGVNYFEDASVQNGIYKRAIIIATNVAEASVTIPGLTYVVDNGYSKVNLFDREYNISKLEVQKISESSRTQRKGRVGRVGDGTVYYMYKKNARKDVKPKYKITQENLTSTFLGLLAFKNLEDIKKSDISNYQKLIISLDVNPNIINGLFLNSQLLTRNNNDSSNMYTITSGLYNIYMENYFIFNNVPQDIYFNIPKNNNMTECFYVFNNGQIFTNLLDMKGNFYLIHPFEENLKRNVLNNIIKYKNINTPFINIKEFKYLISNLFSYGLLIDYKADFLYNDYNEISSVDREWVKTELGQKVSLIISKFEETTIPDAITLLAANSMGCLSEVLEIKILLEIIQFDLTKLAFSDKKWNIFRDIYKNPKFNSDIIFLYEIIKKLKNNFSDSFTFISNQSKTKNILLQDFNKKLNEFKKLNNKNKEIPKIFDGELWNKLKNIRNNGELQTKYTDIFKSDKSTFNLIYQDKKEILKWADSNYLNSKMINDFIKKLSKLYSSKIIFEDSNLFDFTNKFNTNFMKILTTGTIEEKIIRSFIYGRPNQFTYSLVKSGPPNSVMNYAIIPVKFKETLSELSNESIFYIKYFKQDDNPEIEASILSKVDFNWLIPANPLLINPILVPDIIKINNSELFYSNSEHINRIKKMMINNWNKNKILWYSEDMPIMKNFYNKISKLFSTNNR
jgi:hypothetical protein